MSISASSNAVSVQRAVAKSDKGQLYIVGGSTLPALNFALRSENFEVARAKRQRAKANIDIRLQGSTEAPDIVGDVVILSALYDLGAESKSKKKTEEKAEEPTASPSSTVPPPAIWLQTYMDIRARWERDVWYRDGITGVETQGDLRIRKARGARDLSLTGQIASIQGNYYYYGKEFVIENAQIQFTGEPGLNPLLNIRASYEADPTIVYLEITGEAKKPILKMRSIPPLPEQDILSVLVFGRPLNELNTAGGSGSTSNQQMARVAGGVLGSYVTRGLRQTGIEQLDLDLLNIEPTDRGNRVVVGRYITRNFFVSYGHTMATENAREVTANYYLSKNWMLEGGAGGADTQNHMDLLFRYPLNAHGAKAAGIQRQSPFRNTLDRPTPLAPYNSTR